MEQLIDSDIIEKVIDFLGFLPSVTIFSRLSKTAYKKVIQHYLVHKKGVEDGKPLESSGRRLCHLLEVARFLALDLNVVDVSPQARQLVERTGSLHSLRQPIFFPELACLNACIYTYWNSMPNDLTRGIFDELKAYVNSAEEDYYGAKEALDRDCKYWKSSRINGTFIVLMERPDGTIIVSNDLRNVYLVLGQAQSLGEVSNLTYPKYGGPPIRGKSYPRPKFHGPLLGSRICGTLINWEEKIVYDGFLVPEEGPTKAVLRKAIKAYTKAVDTNTLIVALAKAETTTYKMEVFSLDEYELVKAELRQKLDEIEATPFAAPSNSPFMCVARRHGYSEQENPDHLVAMIGDQGNWLVPFFQTKELIPTVQEYVELLYQVVVTNRMGKPQTMAIDADVRVEKLQTLLKDTGVHVVYYPPPSPEEKKMFDVRGRSTMATPYCAVCKKTSCTDGSKLFLCSGCRNEYYCCKEHQKEDWKRYKRMYHR
jgi:hypothetical protein